MFKVRQGICADKNLWKWLVIGRSDFYLTKVLNNLHINLIGEIRARFLLVVRINLYKNILLCVGLRNLDLKLFDLWTLLNLQLCLVVRLDEGELFIFLKKSWILYECVRRVPARGMGFLRRELQGQSRRYSFRAWLGSGRSGWGCVRWGQGWGILLPWRFRAFAFFLALLLLTQHLRFAIPHHILQANSRYLQRVFSKKEQDSQGTSRRFASQHQS